MKWRRERERKREREKKKRQQLKQEFEGKLQASAAVVEMFGRERMRGARPLLDIWAPMLLFVFVY